MMETRTGDTTSIQITQFGVISDLDSADFELVINSEYAVKDRFLIKNQELENVTLEVIPSGQTSDDYVEVVIEPGWNPEWVRKIKANANTGSLLWGY